MKSEVTAMGTITYVKLAQFAVAVVANIGALAFLPVTAGFTKPVPTIACVALFVLNLFMLSRLILTGTALSILIPLMTGLIPLSMILVGVLFYGESSSPLRLGLLVAACVLAALAATQR
jgi:multidrug transporter EmrE-like cation transporter